MKKIIILGTGAVAAELTSYIEDYNTFNTTEKLQLLGYLDYEYNRTKYYEVYELKMPILGDVNSYTFSNDVEVLIGISDISFRNKMIDFLTKKSVIFAKFIHPSSIVANTASIGEGCIIYPFCIVGPKVILGDFNIVTSYSFISHDCIIGKGNFFSTRGIAGRVSIGDNNFFGIRSTVIPSISIGNNNIIQAGMTVDKSLKDGTTLFYRYKEQILAIPKI